MQNNIQKLKKPLKFLASLKLAVFIIVSLSIIVAVGTIIESKYDSNVAKAWVYNTWSMYLVMGLLAINLIAVMVDRFPWQTRHYPFVTAHIGILILLLGSWLTAKYGLDGSLRIAIGQTQRMVLLSQTQLGVYVTFNGKDYSKLLDQEVNFLSQNLEKNPIEVFTGEGEIHFSKFLPFVIADRKIVASQDPKAGAALRFQISNANVNMTEWLLQTKAGERAEKVLGPAKVIFANIPEKPTGANEIYFELVKASGDVKGKTKNIAKNDSFKYAVFSRDNRFAPLTGKIEEGGALQTPWVGLEVKILRYYPLAEEKWEFKSKERPGPMTTSVVEFNFQNKNYSLQSNDIIRIPSAKGTYLVGFGHKRVDLGFDILLKDFEVGHHQGTMMAASYKSLVEVGGENYEIAMNEPMKTKGMTFYQASFEQDPGTGAPVASIISVNDDPGRFLKYLGSLLISVGAVWLIYNKRKAARNMGPKAAEEVIL